MMLTTMNSDSKNQDMGPNWGMKAKEMMNKICPEIGKDGIKTKPIMPLPDTSLISEPPTGANLFSGSTNAAQFTKSGNNW